MSFLKEVESTEGLFARQLDLELYIFVNFGSLSPTVFCIVQKWREMVLIPKLDLSKINCQAITIQLLYPDFFEKLI